MLDVHVGDIPPTDAIFDRGARNLAARRPRIVTLQVMSDLHLDAGRSDLPRTAPGVDAVVVAGDTAEGAANAFAFLRAAFPRPTPLVVVLGNREFHGRAIGRERRVARTLAPMHDITLLDDSVAHVAGIKFIGATLWTDYQLLGARSQGGLMHAAASGIKDHASITLLPEPWLKFRPYDVLERHHATRRFLDAELGGRQEGTTVVVTHHAPSGRSLCADKGARELDGCFASDLEDLVAASGAALWVHGHTHSFRDYSLGRTRVLCNPRGRVRHADGFDASLVAEVASSHGR